MTTPDPTSADTPLDARFDALRATLDDYAAGRGLPGEPPDAPAEDAAKPTDAYAYAFGSGDTDAEGGPLTPAGGGLAPMEDLEGPEDRAPAGGGLSPVEGADRPEDLAPARGGLAPVEGPEGLEDLAPARGGLSPVEGADRPEDLAPARGGLSPVERGEGPEGPVAAGAPEGVDPDRGTTASDGAESADASGHDGSSASAVESADTAEPADRSRPASPVPLRRADAPDAAATDHGPRDADQHGDHASLTATDTDPATGGRAGHTPAPKARPENRTDERDPAADDRPQGSRTDERDPAPNAAPQGARTGERDATPDDRPQGARAGDPEPPQGARVDKPKAVRRGPADPVRTLMHRHKDLCSRAVDPLEIAAALEAQGVTDRTAASYRHRDVFSLAEELFARTHREAPRHRPAPPPRALEPVRDALPAVAACLTALAAVRAAGTAQTVLVVAGAVAVTAALRHALARGPLRAEPLPVRAVFAVTGLLAYLLYGDWLLDGVLSGAAGADDLTTGPASTAQAVAGSAAALAAAIPAATAATRWFTAKAANALRASRDLDEFAARIRPLLAATTAMAAAAILTLQLIARGIAGGGTGTTVSATALGVALFLARLLAVHRHARPAATVLAWTAALQATVLPLAVAARLPGLGAVGRPVELLVGAQGPTAVPAVFNSVAAAALLTLAAVSLTRAAAHRSTALPAAHTAHRTTDRRKEQNTMSAATHPHDPRPALPAQGGNR
ncbi:hypothetical protein AB0M28_23840 [Streptomyces sp. NPDC051940]|uniref:hypothetical protein n=1 Tax=Streptomyces sp. NPDC051940 TaxID=3155675 RepID=UPI003434EB8C